MASLCATSINFEDAFITGAFPLLNLVTNLSNITCMVMFKGRALPLVGIIAHRAMIPDVRPSDGSTCRLSGRSQRLPCLTQLVLPYPYTRPFQLEDSGDESQGCGRIKGTRREGSNATLLCHERKVNTKTKHRLSYFVFSRRLVCFLTRTREESNSLFQFTLQGGAPSPLDVSICN